MRRYSRKKTIGQSINFAPEQLARVWNVDALHHDFATMFHIVVVEFEAWRMVSPPLLTNPHILYLDASEVAFVQFVLAVPNHHSVVQILGIAVCVDKKVADLDRMWPR
jgi:hypothetical protein